MMVVDPDSPTRMSESRPDPYVGQVLSGCRIDEVLGRGGMGVVYKATQLSLKRTVAIKILTDEIAGEPQFRERFEREVDILSRLSHPNIVSIYERGEVDGLPYLVMEYVQGTSLREVMREGPLPPDEALRIVRAVLEALEHAHDRGIIHRDIKPENVLLAKGGIVKVADFGLSRLLGPDPTTRLTHTHLVLGTFEYMAPEQREKAKEADERADLYATGVVLYEMIAGELPIGHFHLLSEKRPQECDARIDEVVRRSLDKEPARRYQRASEMAGAVSRLLTPASGTPLPEARARASRAAPAKKPHRLISPRGWRFGITVTAIWIGIVFAANDGLMDHGDLFWLVFAGIISTVTLARLAPWIRSHEIPVAREEEKLPSGFGERLLEHPQVQTYIADTVGRDRLWASFPDGVEFEREGERLAVEIPGRHLREEGDARALAVVIGHVIEANSGGRARRIVADYSIEARLGEAPCVVEREAGAGTPAAPAADAEANRAARARAVAYGVVVPLIAMAGVAWTALRGFDLTSAEWTIWGICIGAAAIVVPPIVQLFTGRLGVLVAGGFALAVLPVGLYFAFWHTHTFDIPIVRVVGEVPDDFARTVLEEPAVQRYVADALRDNWWHAFPEGILFDRSDDVIEIRISSEYVRHESTARQIAVLVAHVMETNAPGRVKRIVSYAPTEKRLQDPPRVVGSPGGE